MSLVSNIKSLLEYHKAIGIDHYPDSKEMRAFFSTTSLEASEDREKVDEPGEGKLLDLSALDAQIMVCEGCALGKNKLRAVPGKGGDGAKLLFVGDWLKTNDNAVFGAEEDKMLALMIKAIKLSEEDVFVTNILKCAVGSLEQPVAENINICMDFLQKQVLAIKPKIICAMGPIAAKVLLGQSAPISKLRGRFHCYKDEAGKDIMMMATYHPSFLLKNPEMKKATWLDLQAIEQMLKK